MKRIWVEMFSLQMMRIAAFGKQVLTQQVNEQLQTEATQRSNWSWTKAPPAAIRDRLKLINLRLCILFFYHSSDCSIRMVTIFDAFERLRFEADFPSKITDPSKFIHGEIWWDHQYRTFKGSSKESSIVTNTLKSIICQPSYRFAIPQWRIHHIFHICDISWTIIYHQDASSWHKSHNQCSVYTVVECSAPYLEVRARHPILIHSG